MSQNERVCRVGSAVLSPVIALAIGGAIIGLLGGITFGLCQLSDSLAQLSPSPHSPIVMFIGIGVLLVMVIATVSAGLYPLLYRHCRGAAVLAQFESFDKEEKEIRESTASKLDDLNRRKAEFMRSLRTADRGAKP